MQTAFFAGDADRGGTLDTRGATLYPNNRPIIIICPVEVMVALQQGGFPIAQRPAELYFKKYSTSPQVTAAYKIHFGDSFAEGLNLCPIHVNGCGYCLT